jgi:hypothetical protein
MAFSKSKNAGPQVGDFIWHLQPDSLLGRLYKPLSDHIAEVQTEPEAERKTHLRLMKPVRGPFPPAFRKATATYDRACAVDRKVKAVWEKELAGFERTQRQGEPRQRSAAGGLLRLHG